MKGIVASTAGLSILLDEGIGDTIRVSLTPAPGGDARATRSWSPSRSSSRSGCARSCPRSRPAPAAAGRPAPSSRRWRSGSRATSGSRCRSGATRIPGVEEMSVAVMGCVVNGPGESQARRHRDLPAGHVRGAGRAGVRRRPPRSHAARRRPRGRVHRHPRGLRLPPLPGAGRGALGASRACLELITFEPSTLPGVYFGQLNGRSATWVTPTFLFERRR